MKSSLQTLLQRVFLALCLVLLISACSGKADFTGKTEDPCSEPLTLRIGDIDQRFDVTKEELAELVQEVSNAWSEATNNRAIQLASDGDIAVNLIYDKEQKLTDRERQYKDRIEVEEHSISMIEREYNRLSDEYESGMQQYEVESQRLQQSIDRLNRWVNQTNNEGGFNQQNLSRYEDRKQEIDLKKRELARLEQRLKQKASELNSKVTFLNERIDDKNKLIDEYNQQFAGVREFTQGVYEWTADSKDINIFHFIDRDELKLVLAHEVGHALGIGHVSNPKSVMHKLMGKQARPGIELTVQDIQALQNVCNQQLN